MAKITRHNVTDEQFLKLLIHFDAYKRQLEAVPQTELNKYNMFEKRKFNKLRTEVVEFWEELDRI